MRTVTVLTIVVGLVAGASVGQEVEIQSLNPSGELTWIAPSNSDCTVEWASSLTPTADWQRSWIALKDIPCTGGTSRASVPMYYRVACRTNGLFVRMPIGRTYAYTASNTVGQVWTQELSCVGVFSIPAQARDYVFLQVTEVYEGTAPLGSGESEGWFWRATEQGAYLLSGLADFAQEDYLEWQDAPIGTTWTNMSGDDPPEPIFTTIETNETVVVGAGTFPGCIRFLHTMTNQSPPHTQWRQWIKPGFFMVKEVTLYDTGHPQACPITFDLQSWHEAQ